MHEDGPLAPGALVAAYRRQIWPEPGTEALIGAHLEREYGGHVASVAALDAAVYAIDWADGRGWIARLFPPARSLASVEGDAEILRFLAKEQFAAERCAAATAVTSMDGRAVLITGRVSGTSGRQARGSRFFQGLGELLGRLQTLESTDGVLRRPAGSWHHLSFDGGGRREDIEALSRLLTDAQEIAPARDRPLYGLLRERLAELDDCDDLPQALVHPDFSSPNTIVSPDSGTVLIDWANAGRGARILALGTLLACTGGDAKLVDAVIASYRRHIQLGPDEIARLPDAIRGFGLILDCWTAAFRPKALERIVKGRLAKWYVAKVIATRAQRQLRSA